MTNRFTTQAQFRVHYETTYAVWTLSSHFLQEFFLTHQDLVFICIGTDRSTGDALGPLVGTYLQEQLSFPFPIYGTLSKPVHALNLEDQLQVIEQQHPSATVVAIDACLGKKTSIGQIVIQQTPLQPGLAVGKQLPSVGDFSIKGIVNVAGYREHSTLQNTRLATSFQMGRVISHALSLAYRRASLSSKQLTSPLV